jgi:hypothetical protein
MHVSDWHAARAADVTAVFVAQADELGAARCLAQNTRASLAREAPGLGTLSDVEIALDGATVGKVYPSSNDPMLLVGLILTSPAAGRNSGGLGRLPVARGTCQRSRHGGRVTSVQCFAKDGD